MKKEFRFLGYCPRCGEDVEVDWCEKCSEYVQEPEPEPDFKKL